MQKNWKKITITNLDKDPELLLPTFYEFKSLGLEQKPTSIEIYFSNDVDTALLKKRIQEDMRKYKMQGQIKIKSLKSENWHLIWKKDFEPVEITDNIQVVPAWIESPDNDKLIIKINPGMAFGTGTHATTQMALELLENSIQPDSRILDAGCGSGILTVAALKMGAQRVEAWDITEVIRDNFQEHLALNDIPTGYELKIGDVANRKSYPFDLILSNIQKNVNIKLLKSLAAANYEGRVIFTGILKEEAAEFREALQKYDKEILMTLEKGEWIAFTVK